MSIPFRNALKVLPLLAASFSLQAATLFTDENAPVLGAEPVKTQSPSATPSPSQSAANAQLLLQMQQMQQEMQMLRNVVEQQQKNDCSIAERWP